MELPEPDTPPVECAVQVTREGSRRSEVQVTREGSRRSEVQSPLGNMWERYLRRSRSRRGYEDECSTSSSTQLPGLVLSGFLAPGIAMPFYLC